MGKRKAPVSEDETVEVESPGSAHKKHKKHKKKHKRKRDQGCDDDSVVEGTSQEDMSPTKPAIKLKIKIGGQTLSTQSIMSPVNIANAPIIPIKAEVPGKDEDVDIDDSGIDNVADVAPGVTKLQLGPALAGQDATGMKSVLIDKDGTFVTKKKGEDTSDEEQQWLDALEAGTLDDNGEIKKEKDPSLLTARQRALIHGTREENLQQLPSGYKTAELTEEQLQRRQQRATKRRQQAQEKREKDKKQTLERLLKKQDAKSKGTIKSRSRKNQVAPMFRYIQRIEGATIGVPQGFNFPFQAQEQKIPPTSVQLCGIKGCTNPKKYSCSQTSVPLCSLQCYKKNQLQHQQRASLASVR